MNCSQQSQSWGFCLLGMKLGFEFFGTSTEKRSSGFPGIAGGAAAIARSFPECWERDRVDLARMSAKIGVPHSILCNIAFEHGLEMTVDEVQAARLLSVASVPMAEEMSTQAAAASASFCCSPF